MRTERSGQQTEPHLSSLKTGYIKYSTISAACGSYLVIKHHHIAVLLLNLKFLSHPLKGLIPVAYIFLKELTHEVTERKKNENGICCC